MWRRSLPSLRPRLSWGAAGVVGAMAVLVAGAGWWAGADRPGSAGAEQAERGPADVTAPVERRELSLQLVSRGTVVAAELVEVLAHPAGEGALAVVVTRVLRAAGDQVGAGEVVVELNNRPLLVLAGPVPLFRDIRPGDTGSDVAALQASLGAAGHRVPAGEAGRFGPATQEALRRVYAAAGYEPPYTRGDRASTEMVVRDADAAVARARERVERARAAAASDPQAAAVELRAARDELSAAEAERHRVRASEGVVAAARELVAVPQLPAVVYQVPTALGARLEAGERVALLGSGGLRVEVELTRAQLAALRDGTTIEVDSRERGYEASCTGDLAAASPAHGATDGPAGGGEAGGGEAGGDQPPGAAPGGSPLAVAVTCEPAPPPAMLGENLRVRINVPVSEGPALVVPVTAVVTEASGATYLDVARGGSFERVAVHVHGEADGFVAVEPVDGALEEGAEVRVRRG